MRIIWSLDHGLQSLSKRMQATLGLTGPQRVALRIVGRLPGITAGTLAEVLNLHPSTLTGILQRLEARGLVRRTADASDRRRARLALTAAGRRLDVPAPNTAEAVLGEVLARFPRRRTRDAAEVLGALAGALAEASR
jgi:DNA-binding MarR family transcriptional regulator